MLNVSVEGGFGLELTNQNLKAVCGNEYGKPKELPSVQELPDTCSRGDCRKIFENSIVIIELRLNTMGWLEDNIIPLLSLVTTAVLVIINIVYIYLNKKTLDVAVHQSNLAYNPIIGIRLLNMRISEVFGPSRRQLSVGLNLTNVGNTPAIEVLVDAEIELEYSAIDGERIIPARHEPNSLSFIRSGEEITDEPGVSPNFGNTCVSHLLDDFRECQRLNTLRIETDPTETAYNASVLRIFAYYRNNIGQHFKSVYETHLDIEKIPKENESAELAQIYVPRPRFEAGPVSRDEVIKEITQRDTKRKLCGW